LKIIYHHRTQAEDAQGIHIYEMIQAFRKIGHQVKIVALVERNEATSEKQSGGKWESIASSVPVWIYELLELGYNFFGFLSLLKGIRSFRPDFIYERYSLNTFCGVLAARAFKIPIILEVNAPLYQEQKNLGKLVFKKLAKLTERWICSNATHTIVVTDVLKQILAKQGVPEDKIVVMHNGIDPQEINLQIKADVVQEKYNLNGKLVIGFVGWFRKWHGLEMLLQFMLDAKREYKNVRLLLVGDGPAYPDLLDFAQKNSLEEQVIFTGAVAREELPAHIAAMHIAVQPSATSYACPMKIIEYMGMAKNIVAPNQANIAEMLENGKSASLFEINNFDKMSDALLDMLNKVKNGCEFGKNAFQTIQDRKYTWEANAQKVIDLL